MMRKALFIVFVFALGMILSVSGFTKAKIRNPAKVDIVSPSVALIAINDQKPFEITVHKAAAESFVTPNQAKASVKITNHSTNDLTIKSIKCVTNGLSNAVVARFRTLLLAGRTTVVHLGVDDSSLLVGVDSLEFEFVAEWDGGKSTLSFRIPVDQDEDNSQSSQDAGKPASNPENGSSETNVTDPTAPPEPGIS